MWGSKVLLTCAFLLDGVFAVPGYGLEARGLTSGLSGCKGYAARNVRETGKGVTATLKLNGRGCAVYGPDLKELTLTVEYETGESESPKR